MRGDDRGMYLRAAGLPVQTWLSKHAVALSLPLGAAFVCTHAIWYWSVTQSPLAAVLGALSMLTVRSSLGGDYWGFDGDVGPRTLHAIVVPLLFMLPGWWPLLALVHPGTVHHLLTRRPVDNPSVARAAILYRFPYLFYPIGRRTLVSVAVSLSLPLSVWLVMGLPLSWLVGAPLLVSLGGTAIIQVVSWAFDAPPADIQLLRQFRLVYPVLGLGFAMAYTRWDGLWLLPLALFPPRWLIGFLRDCLTWGDVPAHCPGRDDVEGRWFKDGALAYLQGPAAMVAWYGRKP